MPVTGNQAKGDQEAADLWIALLTQGPPANAITALGGQAWNSQAPKGTKPPYKVFTSIPQPDEVTHGDRRFAAVYEYVVVYVVADDLDAATAGQTAIDKVLDRATGVLNGYKFRCARVMAVSMPQTVNGVTYWRRGGRYRVTVQDQNT